MAQDSSASAGKSQVLRFRLVESDQEENLTGMAGLALYLEAAEALGLRGLVEQHLELMSGGRGWRDWDCVLAAVLVNLSGGDCVQDVDRLEADSGFCRLLEQSRRSTMTGSERRAWGRRWRKPRVRSLPSASSMFRFLRQFDDGQQEAMGEPGKAFIPSANAALQGLRKVNQGLVGGLQRNRRETRATLDLDATLVPTYKSTARHSYKHYRAYQPLNVWWAEQRVVLHTEFRDGNVPAGYELRRVLEESLAQLPAGVKEVRLRSDTAGYQHELLRYCYATGEARFERVSFAVGVKVTEAFRQAVAATAASEWHPLYKDGQGRGELSGREWAEICFVPAGMGLSKKAPVYRYLATREPLAQSSLPGVGEQLELPFQTVTWNSRQYKVFGVVTNLDWSGDEVIRWHDQRCGASEEAHLVMKEELAGGQLPSCLFGVNAAWWLLMVLSLNLNAAMQQLALAPAWGEAWSHRRLKAIRLHFIHLPGRLVHHARQCWLHVQRGKGVLRLLETVRLRIAALQPAPVG